MSSLKAPGGPSRPGREVTVHKEKRGPAENLKKKIREESVLMSQSRGRQVTHMVPGVLPPGAEGTVNHRHRRGFRRTFKAAELTLLLQSKRVSQAAEQRALARQGAPALKEMRGMKV